MTAPPDDIEQALAQAVKQRLIRGESVTVPGLGTFDVEYQPSQVEDQADGSTAIIPPQNTVVFTPEADSSD